MVWSTCGFRGQMRRLWVKPVLSHVVSVEPLDAVVGEVDGGGDEPDGVEAAHDDEEGNGDSHVAGRSGDGAEVEEGLAAGYQTKTHMFELVRKARLCLGRRAVFN